MDPTTYPIIEANYYNNQYYNEYYESRDNGYYQPLLLTQPLTKEIQEQKHIYQPIPPEYNPLEWTYPEYNDQEFYNLFVQKEFDDSWQEELKSLRKDSLK